MNPSTHSTPPEPPRFQPRMIRYFSAISIAILALTLVCSARGAKQPQTAPRARNFSFVAAPGSFRLRRPFPLNEVRIHQLFPARVLPLLARPASRSFAVSSAVSSSGFPPLHFNLHSLPSGPRLPGAFFSLPSRQSLAADVIHRHAAGATDSTGWGIPTTWLAAVAMTLAVVGTVLTFVAAR